MFWEDIWYVCLIKFVIIKIKEFDYFLFRSVNNVIVLFKKLGLVKCLEIVCFIMNC